MAKATILNKILRT